MTDQGRTWRIPSGLALLLVVSVFGALLVPVPGLRSVRVSAQGPPRPDAPPVALTPDLSKQSAEVMAASWARPLEVGVVRPFTVYGPGQRPDMLMSRMLSGEAVTLFPFERDFTFVHDVVAALVGAVDVPLLRRVETFNLGSGRRVSADLLVDTLSEVTGQRPEVSWGPRRPGEPQQTWSDPSSARDRLGLPSPMPLADGLALQHAAAQTMVGVGR